MATFPRPPAAEAWEPDAMEKTRCTFGTENSDVVALPPTLVFIPTLAVEKLWEEEIPDDSVESPLKYQEEAAWDDASSASPESELEDVDFWSWSATG